ncbi:hypothetical protein ACJ41O_012422 [Fusarium nematophilum]
MAELALATIPICMRLIADCLVGYKVFSETKELGRTSQKLFWKFKIQEARLRIWAREWGLLDEQQPGQPCDDTSSSLRDVQEYKFVSETLVRVREAFQDHKQLQTRYGLDLVTEAHGTQQESTSWDFRQNTLHASTVADQTVYDSLTQDPPVAILSQLDLDLQQKRNKTTALYRKVRWVVSDRARFESMVNDLRDYNDGLYSLLSSIERRRLRQALPPEVVPTQNVLSELRDLGQAGEEYADLKPVTELAAVRLQIEAGTATSISTERLKIDGRCISFDVTDGGNKGPPRLLDRALASYSPDNGSSTSSTSTSTSTSSRTVLVEWKLYEKDFGEAVKREQLSRLDSLARLLHVECKPPMLQVPRCLGYIADDWHPRVGFVFEWNCVSSVPIMVPLTLHDALGRKAIPYVGDRFRLAHQLSLSVCILHTAGWLHKGIRSENIIFAPASSSLITGNTSPHLGDPYLLGFEYARPDSPAAISDPIQNATEHSDLYRHPRLLGPNDHLRSRFDRSFDVYALGVVLLEVGFWRRIDEFWHRDYRQRPEQFAHDLRTFHAPKLGSKMGKMYMDVVVACLSGDFASHGASDSSESEDTQQQHGYFWAVVNQLSKLVA